ncbi:MAG: helix-turn-helix domain-containing protein [Planctomycetota bacterium]
MWTFDDFDAWGDAVSGASLRMGCDGIERHEWTLGRVDLGPVVLQVASEGGGNVCYGGNTHAGTMLFLPLTHAHEHFVNGEPLDDESLFAIPRGADFCIRLHKRAHSWCSIALPGDADQWAVSASGSGRMAGNAGTVPRLRRLATDVAAALLPQAPGSPAHEAAARDLLAAAADCLPGRAEPAPALGRRRLDRGDIIRRAMAVIDSMPMMPSAAILAANVGVTSRTLLRAFHEAFGRSPKQYLMLRELHVVRRSLMQRESSDATVADILVRHGIWEFGRFAARYRRQFGELPSHTVRRVRG